MNWSQTLIVPFVALLTAVAAAGEPKPIFNGKDLTGWEGLPGLWSVRDGAITGQSTAAAPLAGNTFLVWKAGEVANFELRFQYRLTPDNDKNSANSGVQYRSKVVDPAKFVVSGYQADFEAGPTYSGILYEEKARGILAQRGQQVTIRDSENPQKPRIEVTGETGKSSDIQAAIRPGDWNDYVIRAKGPHLQHFINGKLTVDVKDESSAGAKSGVLALQLHAGPPMTVQFKDLVLTTLDP
jgi:hypothetical protein